jgi:hypothetical protein
MRSAVYNKHRTLFTRTPQEGGRGHSCLHRRYQKHTTLLTRTPALINALQPRRSRLAPRVPHGICRHPTEPPGLTWVFFGLRAFALFVPPARLK